MEQCRYLDKDPHQIVAVNDIPSLIHIGPCLDVDHVVLVPGPGAHHHHIVSHGVRPVPVNAVAPLTASVAGEWWSVAHTKVDCLQVDRVVERGHAGEGTIDVALTVAESD